MTDQLLTARDVIAQFPEFTYRRVWQAQTAGLITPLGFQEDGDAIEILDVRGMTFRAFMAREGFDSPDPTWSSEDLEAWFLDEGAPPK